MFLTHLFLSSAAEYEDSNRIPVFLSLKDYKENTVSILDFIYDGMKIFDETIKKQSVIKVLQEKRFILLLDGLDEIQTGTRIAFETDIEAFIKSYPVTLSGKERERYDDLKQDCGIIQQGFHLVILRMCVSASHVVPRLRLQELSGKSLTLKKL